MPLFSATEILTVATEHQTSRLQTLPILQHMDYLLTCAACMETNVRGKSGCDSLVIACRKCMRVYDIVWFTDSWYCFLVKREHWSPSAVTDSTGTAGMHIFQINQIEWPHKVPAPGHTRWHTPSSSVWETARSAAAVRSRGLRRGGCRGMGRICVCPVNNSQVARAHGHSC